MRVPRHEDTMRRADEMQAAGQRSGGGGQPGACTVRTGTYGKWPRCAISETCCPAATRPSAGRCVSATPRVERLEAQGWRLEGEEPAACGFAVGRPRLAGGPLRLPSRKRLIISSPQASSLKPPPLTPLFASPCGTLYNGSLPRFHFLRSRVKESHRCVKCCCSRVGACSWFCA